MMGLCNWQLVVLALAIYGLLVYRYMLWVYFVILNTVLQEVLVLLDTFSLVWKSEEQIQDAPDT